MTRRSVRWLWLVGLLALLIVTAGAGSAKAINATYWCTAHPRLDPCVAFASIDGSPLAPDDPTYDVVVSPVTVAGAKTVQWDIEGAQPGHTFGISIETTVVPRVIDGYGASMSYTRTDLGGGRYVVTITGQPIELDDQDGCTYNGPPVCSEVSPGPPSANFDGEIDDYNYRTYNNYNPPLPEGWLDSFYGMDMYTNIAETGLPPTVIERRSGPELQIQMADHHFEQDGTTVVHGDFYVRIPGAFLQDFFGINDPSTLETDGLSASIGSGNLTVTDEPGGAAVDVTVTGVTFSLQTLTIKLGNVAPSAPGRIKVRRLRGGAARITFQPAQAHGQKVIDYEAGCHPQGGGKARSVLGGRSPLTIHGLKSRRYSCTLRAVSKSAVGPPSRSFRIPA